MWALPTFRRPERCAEVLRCLTEAGCSTPGIVIVNGTDDAEAYQRIMLPDGWRMTMLPSNIGVCQAMNWAFQAYPKEPFYGLICDDELVYTAEWDKKLIAAAGSKGIAHGNDGWKSGGRMHMYVTWGGDLVREVGWWALPGLWHWFHDNVWEEMMAGRAEVRFLADVRCEHRHYRANKSGRDATYAMGESRADKDRRVFDRWFFSPSGLLAVRDKLDRFYGTAVGNADVLARIAHARAAEGRGASPDGDGLSSIIIPCWNQAGYTRALRRVAPAAYGRRMGADRDR